jgi:hypothetical protein
MTDDTEKLELFTQPHTTLMAVAVVGLVCAILTVALVVHGLNSGWWQ